MANCPDAGSPNVLLVYVHRVLGNLMNLYVNKNKKMSFFKSNENIQKKEDGSYYVVVANKASSVTL